MIDVSTKVVATKNPGIFSLFPEALKISPLFLYLKPKSPNSLSAAGLSPPNLLTLY